MDMLTPLLSHSARPKPLKRHLLDALYPCANCIASSPKNTHFVHIGYTGPVPMGMQTKKTGGSAQRKSVMLTSQGYDCTGDAKGELLSAGLFFRRYTRNSSGARPGKFSCGPMSSHSSWSHAITRENTSTNDSGVQTVQCTSR